MGFNYSVVIDRSGEEVFLFSPASENFRSRQHRKTLFDAVVEGRIDNKRILCSALHLDENTSAENLIVSLYNTYGQSGLYRLDGAFSLVLHDAENQLTLLYRSFLNGYPLYYTLRNNQLSVSTDPVALLHRSDVTDRLDGIQMSALFALDTDAWNGTVFADLKEVAHGEMIAVSPGGVVSKKRALHDVLVPPKFGSESEMIGEYLRLLETVLGKHISPQNRYGIMLSSGMDSGSLAALASRQLREQGSDLQAFSWSLPHYGAADESQMIQKLCTKLGIELYLFNGEEYTPFGSLDDDALLPGLPFVNLYWQMLSHLYRKASDDGVNVLLNGHYGDNLYRSPNNLLVEILKHGRFDLFMPTLKPIIERHGYAGAMKRSPEVRALFKRMLFFYCPKRALYRTPQWLTRSAKSMYETLKTQDDTPTEKGYEIFSSALSKYNTGSGMGRHFESRFGIERIEPYFDPALINYTLRLPLYMAYRSGQNKFFAREAMRGLLPETVRTQSRVGVMSRFAYDGFVKNRVSVRERLLDDRESWNDYIDEQWMEQKLGKGAEVEDKELLVIWMCLTMGPWLRAVKPGGRLYEGR